MGSGIFSGHMTPGQPGVNENIDLKDRKILFELSRNGRLSSAAIGRAVGLSREVVDYRINQLTQRGILSGFVTLIDTSHLGYRKHTMYLRFQNTTEEEEETIINSLVAEKKIIWVATCAGGWDLGILTASRTAAELSDTISLVSQICNGHLGEYHLLEDVHDAYLGLGLLAEDFTPKPPPIEREGIAFQRQLATQPHKFGTIGKRDLDILRALIREPLAPLRHISQETHITTQTAKKSIEHLISSGILCGFMPMISFYKLGYQWYLTWLRFNAFTPADETRLFQYCKQHPNILWYIRTIGTWYVQLSIFATDILHYREILGGIRKEFASIIQHHDTALVLNQYKYAHEL